jgi:hypothetical protein
MELVRASPKWRSRTICRGSGRRVGGPQSRYQHDGAVGS